MPTETTLNPAFSGARRVAAPSDDRIQTERLE